MLDAMKTVAKLSLFDKQTGGYAPKKEIYATMKGSVVTGISSGYS